MRIAQAFCVLLGIPISTLCGTVQTAAAQQVADETVPTGKGVVGGALFGSEAVMLTEAALRVKPAWAYVVGGVAGGVGGGVGGYFLEQEADARLSLYLLAAGMALAIPTTVAVLSATAYRPPKDYTQDRTPTDEPLSEPAAPDWGAMPDPAEADPAAPEGDEPVEPPPAAPGAAPPPATTPQSRLLRPALPPALVGLERGSLVLRVPAVEVRNLYTRRELELLGLHQKTEVRVPVFSAWF